METPPNKFLYDPGPVKSFKYSVRHERAMDCRLHLVNRPKLVRAHTCPQIVYLAARLGRGWVRREVCCHPVRSPWIRFPRNPAIRQREKECRPSEFRKAA